MTAAADGAGGSGTAGVWTLLSGAVCGSAAVASLSSRVSIWMAEVNEVCPTTGEAAPASATAGWGTALG
ncbi:MAG: hypothetical protein MUC82_05700 [Cypionkella sp.]|nr:hypothetical protein [Cypionkella sp.]